MDTNFSAEDIAFREEVRKFFDQHFNEEMQARVHGANALPNGVIEWQRRLYEQGWIAPAWPAEYGGTGWTLTQRFIFDAERSARGVPDVIPFGLTMVGPVIYTFGNDEQKKKFLPRILKSEDWWCQGYSEPGSGSDLASLQTRAELDGDEYVVNGAKIWTTYAQYADWIFCLVRTDNSGKKQEGISFLLIDMASPGVTVNPIIGIDGRHSLNEVQFQDVRVPRENLIGEEGKGWTYAKFLLENERTGIAGVAECGSMLMELKAIAARESCDGQALAERALFQQRLSSAEIELMALEYGELRALASTAKGQGPGAVSAILKLQGTELQQTLQGLKMQLAGYYSGVLQRDENVTGHDFGFTARADYMYGRAATIYGGSNEIQKNITAKLVLGL